MKPVDLQFVKHILSEIDPSLDGSQQNEAYNAALTVFSAIVCGPDPRGLAAFTGLPIEVVATIRERMIRAELWTELDVNCDHWFVAEDVVSSTAFWVDVLVAEGLLVRNWDEAEGDYRYCDSAYATANAKSETVN